MSEAIKPTQGEWLVKRSGGDEWYFGGGELTIFRTGAEHEPIAVMGASAETEAYFNFIADALNVRDTTGLTPRQLVERVKELEGALRNFTEGCSLSVDAGAIARAALSKALPNTVAEVK